MSELMDYLIDNEGEIQEIEEVTLSDRLKDFKFKIKPISGKEFHRLKAECRSVRKKVISFDDATFNEKLIIKCCIEPNFSNEESIKKAGVHTPNELVNKLLKAGEITDLANAITTLSGFDEEPEELEAEVKN